MKNRYAVILAAGRGTRMKSTLYKVLHPVCEKPMVLHIVEQIKRLSVDKIATVIGYGADKVKEVIGESVSYVLQKEQLGTGHAVMQASGMLAEKEGTTIVVCGDTPLIRKETLEKLFHHHEKTQATATVLTTSVPDPSGYGRIIRDASGHVERIVEDKEATAREKGIKEINSGIYCFDNRHLFQALRRVTNDNVQGEYYLPDVIEIFQQQEQVVAAYHIDDFEETLGVNDRVALAKAEAVMRRRINERHMKNGVTITDPSHTYISVAAEIGQDTTIRPGSVLAGHVKIGKDCVIGPHAEIKDSNIADGTMIKQSVVHDSVVGSEVAIGPYAHIRPESVLGNQIKIGNFVEVKKSQLDDGAKASHLAYIGDAEIGKEVNLGCGSITVNYDGENKAITKVKDGAFIGCNVNLIAPVTVGEGAYIAAGSTITDPVPDNALSIARSRQTNKPDYAKGKKKH